jgi:hypothetical protein
VEGLSDSAMVKDRKGSEDLWVGVEVDWKSKLAENFKSVEGSWSCLSFDSYRTCSSRDSEN